MREHRTVYDAPASNIARGVMVCVGRMPTGHTPELGLGFAVALVDMPALAALPAGVSRIDSNNRGVNHVLSSIAKAVLWTARYPSPA